LELNCRYTVSILHLLVSRNGVKVRVLEPKVKDLRSKVKDLRYKAKAKDLRSKDKAATAEVTMQRIKANAIASKAE